MKNESYEQNYLEIIAFKNKIKYFNSDSRILDEQMYSNRLESLKNIYYTKESDYSNGVPLANFRESTKVGIPPYKGVLIRMGDKVRRLKTFMDKKQFKVESESYVDTLYDLSNYSMLGLILFQEIDHSKSITYDNDEYLAICELYKWISICSIIGTMIDNADELHDVILLNIFNNYDRICLFVKGMKN